MMKAYIIAAKRTPVTPRGGDLAKVSVAELAGTCLHATLSQAGVAEDRVDDVILGNALYGGGNPARVASLWAGLPESIPAMTLDTQCCAGLDALLIARARIASGEADVIIAGGVESYSRSPLRFTRPLTPDEAPVEYQRPPFTPWPERDPDLIVAADALAQRLSITREQQEAYAQLSHEKGHGASFSTHEMCVVSGVSEDTFTRRLTPEMCMRLPSMWGTKAMTKATVAVQADGAATVLMVSERFLNTLTPRPFAVEVVGGVRVGSDPEHPALAPIDAVKRLLTREGVAIQDISVIELMEAFAVQAIACIQGLSLDVSRINRKGGALARGHPIGASGAILAVRLFHELREQGLGMGLATIPAAGGLGSALLLRV
jgi:acetyl-CoA C-acetyltransferase